MKPSKHSGMTMPSLMLSLAVSGVLIVAAITLASNSLTQIALQSARAELLGNATAALDKISADIRLSAGADQTNRWQDANSPQGSAERFGWQSDSITLVLAAAVTDKYDNIIFADSAKYTSVKNNLIYFIKDKTLYRRVLAAPISGSSAKSTCPLEKATIVCTADKPLAHKVSAFSVRYLSAAGSEVPPDQARLVELRIQLAGTKYGRSVNATSTQRTAFRNE